MQVRERSEVESVIENASNRNVSWQGEKMYLMGIHDCLYDWKLVMD